MDIDLKRVQYKLDTLAKADDYVSDRAAAKALQISHSTIHKYRRQLRAQTPEESLRQLGAPRGRPRRRVLNQDRDFMIWWVRHENPDWGDREVATAMRGLRAGRVWARDVAKVPKKGPKSFSVRTTYPKEAQSQNVFERALERCPVRILYMLLSTLEEQARATLGVIAVGRKNGLLEDSEGDEGERQCRMQIATTRALKNALKENEGRGCGLDELLQMEVRIPVSADLDLQGFRLEPLSV